MKRNTWRKGPRKWRRRRLRMKEKMGLPGIEPTISEVEVEGANQWATPSQTKL